MKIRKLISVVALLMPVSMARAEVNVALFGNDALVQAPEKADCTLTTGAASTCVRLVVKYKPDHLDIGPFCPETLDAEGGIWSWDGDKPGLYRLNRAFFEMLASMGFKFHDDDGKLHIADPAAGKPEWDHACLSAAEAPDVLMTILLPDAPQRADKPSDLGTVAGVGVALDGVPIFADAPSVLDTGHLPALDPCAGHIDPGGWYHWHGTATDVDSVYHKHDVDAHCGLAQSATAQFGYAYDGYAMFGTADPDGTIPTDLDACGGHTLPGGDYHYHSTLDFPNLPKCLTGVQAKDNFKTTAKSGIGADRPKWWWPFK